MLIVIDPKVVRNAGPRVLWARTVSIAAPWWMWSLDAPESIIASDRFERGAPFRDLQYSPELRQNRQNRKSRLVLAELDISYMGALNSH
jgi:hypothetical protein